MGLLRPTSLPRLIAVLLVLLPVVVVTTVPGWRPSDMMARHLGKDLEFAGPELLAMRLEQLAELDQAGLPVLTAALVSRRPALVESVASTLHTLLDRWARLPASESSPRVTYLAKLLAQDVEQYPPATRYLAADLAARLLRWPTPANGPRDPALLAHCEELLRAGMAELARNESSATDASLAASAPQTQDAARVLSAADHPAGVVALAFASGLGEELPVEEVDSASRLPISEEDQVVPGDPERAIAWPDLQHAPAASSTLRESKDATGPLASPPAEPATPMLEPVRQPAATQQDNAVSGESPASVDLDQVPDLELIRLWNGAGDERARAIEDQLRRRGLSELEVNLARRLADPDPRVRRELVHSLPQLPTSPGKWLFWLSYDPAPEIRRLVVSLMATSHDPRLERRLRTMLVEEADPAVRYQVERLFENQLKDR